MIILGGAFFMAKKRRKFQSFSFKRLRDVTGIEEFIHFYIRSTTKEIKQTDASLVPTPACSLGVFFSVY